MTGIACAHQDGLVKGFSPRAIEHHNAGLPHSVAGYDEAPAIDQIDIGNGRIADHHSRGRTPKANIDRMIDAHHHHRRAICGKAKAHAPTTGKACYQD